MNREESALLEAVLERLIPTDGNGPGANEAHVACYIHKALGSDYRVHESTYSEGLIAIDGYALREYGCSFVALAPAQQDQVLSDFETGTAFADASGSYFFRLVLAHAMEGMFGHPHHGGNRRQLGWQLIGYPGPRYEWGPEDQELDRAPESLRGPHDGDLPSTGTADPQR
jgi:gluconate 2-dehydrogenase gamma chain